MKKEKTVAQLYKQFCNTYSIKQLEENRELLSLQLYFQNRCHMAGGNYVHVPEFEMRKLIKRHLGYRFPERKSALRKGAIDNRKDESKSGMSAAKIMANEPLSTISY